MEFYLMMIRYSFELHQERVCGQVPHPLLLLPSFTYPHILTLLTSNSLLMIAWLASVIQLSLTYPHIPDEAQMNKWSPSFIRGEVSFRLIFVFEGLSCNILWFSKPDKDNRYIYFFFLKILFLIIPNMVNMHTGIQLFIFHNRRPSGIFGISLSHFCN